MTSDSSFQSPLQESLARVHRPIYRFLDTVGDGTGDKNANGDYATTPTVFRIAPPSTETYFLFRFMNNLVDNGSIDAGGWGNGPALTNGVRVLKRGGAGQTLTDFLDGFAVNTNSGWSILGFDAELSDFGGGNGLFRFKWTFLKSGQPLVLRGARGESFNLEFSDDVSSIIANTFQVQGFSNAWA